jgi:MFS family permease
VLVTTMSEEKRQVPPQAGFQDGDAIERQPTENSNDGVPNKQLDTEGMSRGVVRIEAVKMTMASGKHSKLILWLFAASVMVCAWAYALDNSTTFNYDPYATSSFGKHSMISTLQIATSIISAVCRPILAKISDVSSRPATYVLVVLFYTVGYIIVASCTTISAFIVGQAFVAIGGAGVNIMNSIIVGDLSPLKWRGFIHGMLSFPFIINCWFAGLIVEDLLDTNWRWGYGMFAIIMPVVLSPAVFIMFWLQRRAKKLHIIEDKSEKKPIQKRVWDIILEVDAIGLIFLGFGWSLLLLPFSLYPYADNEWKNPSLIAMMVVGGILLIVYVLYEMFVAPFPSAPKRVVFNRTFIMSVIIDFIYMVAGYMRSTYLSSYTWIVTDWSAQDWTYYNNTLTLALCIFGIVAGVIFRATHRYKYWQVSGLIVLVIGVGVMVDTDGLCRKNVAALVMSQILIGFGGGFSVVASQVAAQASVPHQDLAIVISLLSLWSSIGSAIGSAIAAPVWSSKMPGYLREYLPSSVSDEQVMEFFGNIKAIKSYPFNGEVRQGAIHAYSKTMWYLFVPSLSISFIPVIAACCQTNFFLGDSQNAVEDGTMTEDPRDPEVERNLTWKDRLANFFNKPLV